MKFYFDKQSLNLDHVPEIKEIRSFSSFEKFYNRSNVEFVYTKDYNEQGVYLIEVSKLTHQWTGSLEYDHSFNLIKEIPNHVIKAVQEKKLRIVIISVVEGDTFVKEMCDGFRLLTDNILERKLPPFSVLVMSANVIADEEYKAWCKRNKETPIIEFIGATEGIENKPNKPDPICGILAQSRQEPYAFSSLNRARRHHRTEHLFYLAAKGLLAKGLVSGVNVDDQSPKYLDVPQQVWDNTLKSNFPRTVDFDHLELKETNPANEINLDIYNNAMLSVVTETYFEEPGLYFSEKTFKPILVGSPQLTLAQPFAIKYLKEKFDINLDFPGIDSKYDTVTDNKKRFIMFHKALFGWVKLKDHNRRKIVCIWEEQLKHNMNTLHSIDFKKIIVDDIVQSTSTYFAATI